MRILIADDNDDIRLLLRMQLEIIESVDDIDEAANGVEAIEQAGSHQPDVVILDLDMPMMSGDAALPLLRTVAPRSYLVVHSATPLHAAPREGLEHADAYLQKLRDDVGDFVRALVVQRT